jgi:hypothetical protein
LRGGGEPGEPSSDGHFVEAERRQGPVVLQGGLDVIGSPGGGGLQPCDLGEADPRETASSAGEQGAHRALQDERDPADDDPPRLRSSPSRSVRWVGTNPAQPLFGQALGRVAHPAGAIGSSQVNGTQEATAFGVADYAGGSHWASRQNLPGRRPATD